MNDQPDQDPGGDGYTGGVAAKNRGAGSSRRRFIKGGAAAAPVILTFTSRPVLGFEHACMTPSRMISGNHSGFAGPTTCGGASLSSFKSLAQGTSKPTWFAIKFTSVFSPLYTSTSGTVPDTFGDVLLNSEAGYDGNTNSVPKFAAYIIAAYLNALNVQSVSAVLQPAQVVHMWSDVINGAGFCPQLTMCWNATGVIGYLQNSGIVPV